MSNDTTKEEIEFDFETKLSELALNIRQKCNISTTYNPEEDILNFIDYNVPDLLVVTGKDDKHYPISLYCTSDYPLLGKVLHLDLKTPFDDECQMKEVPIDGILGNHSTWRNKFDKDPVLFLEEFILDKIHEN